MPLQRRRPGLRASGPSGAWRRRRSRPMRGTSGSSRSSWASIWAGHPTTGRWRNLRFRISAPSWPGGGGGRGEPDAGAAALQPALLLSLRREEGAVPQPRTLRHPRAEAAACGAEAIAAGEGHAAREGRRARHGGNAALGAGARRSGADAALCLRASHFGSAGADRGQTDQPCSPSPARATRRASCRCCPWRGQAVALYLELCPFALPPKEPMFRGVKGGPLNARNIQLLIARLRGALGLA